MYKKLLSKILFLEDFPTLIGSAFAFVAKLNGISSQIDFSYFPVCKKESSPASLPDTNKRLEFYGRDGGVVDGGWCLKEQLWNRQQKVERSF